MIKLKVVLLFLVPPILTFSQNWQKVGIVGFDWPLRYLYADTNNDLLYASGNFEYVDGINVNQIAKWNGTYWDSLSHGSVGGGLVTAMTYHNSSLYAGGNFLNDWNYLLGKWSGSMWDTSGLQIDGAPMSFRIDNGELYIGGGFTVVNNMTGCCLAKYNGTNWTLFNTSNWTGSGILALEFYNGELYCGGNFFDAPNGISRLAKYNGTNFTSVGIGIVGQFAYVSDMAIYQNDLVIAGGFHSSDGNIGNGIIKWDGTNLTPVGTGLGTIYTINDIEVYGGYLYAVGDFTNIDGVSASHIARWDGTSWSAIGPEQFDNNIQAITFYQNQLYVGGGFKTVDTDTVNFIAKYTGPLSVKEEKQNFSFNVYPNPITDKFIINCTEFKGKTEIEIYNMFGARIYKSEITNPKTEISISSLRSGIYFVEVQNEKSTIRKKIVKL